MFAIVSLDYTTEYTRTIRSKYKKSYEFASQTIPHTGKRYKTYDGALGMCMKINEDAGHPICRVIETLI